MMRSNSEIIHIVYNMLTSLYLPDEEMVTEIISEYPEFEKLYGHIIAIREFSYAMGKGELTKNVPDKGFIISNMKSLQSTLRHLTWQTQRIADGDYTQRVDFLGDFSESFNQMIDRLNDTTRQLVNLAHIDSLTKIPNRLSLFNFFEREFAIAKRNRKDLCAFMFDIDHFKRINDIYGHTAGDQVLIKFAGILTKQFRSTDILARYGGEEFIAVLPDIKHEYALMIGNRALSSVSSTKFIINKGKALKVTTSIGHTAIRDSDTTLVDMVKRCDEALYNAKNSGRNRMCSI